MHKLEEVEDSMGDIWSECFRELTGSTTHA
jgi:hypothetical protein